MDHLNEEHCNATQRSKLLSKRVSPKLLKRSAGTETCCIFRIPWTPVQINSKAYEPKIVSIGPYHHGKQSLEMIQQHKHRFLEFFLEKSGTTLQELLRVVSEMEEAIRASYSENLDRFASQDLIDMVLLDSCFILVVLLVVSNKVDHPDSDDAIFKMPWILPAIRSDLLLLENQVPFFLLEALFGASKTRFHIGINKMAFEFFGYSIQRPKRVWAIHYHVKAKHLVDLIRKTFIPTWSHETSKESCLPISKWCRENAVKTRSSGTTPTGLILSSKKLRLLGIKLESYNKAETFLAIRLEKGRLFIPTVVLDDFLSLVFLNCVAFEQLYSSCSNHMTSYVAFMGCLMNDEADAMFLGEKGIIENYFGTGNEVSQFFKGVCKGIVFNPNESYLADVFEGVNMYTSKGYHVQWAGFKYTHFDSPWTCLSSSAAFTLIVLTLIQTFFTSYAYFHPPQSK
ncbi:hypothetical protein AALP_AA8G379200 [Arabis alpina]|uniref:Uncharacterized protein n=1 Tax=Arabis alpina TaxID=50452 RepID=A0A087GC07_ARAAL|nr:hypothetical protein AALP_AA8G379200 [Arabis alpina]